MIKKIRVATQKDTILDPKGNAIINWFTGKDLVKVGNEYVEWEDLDDWTDRYNENAGVDIHLSTANVRSNFGLNNFKKGSNEWVQLMRQYFPQDVAEMSEEEIKEFEPTSAQKAQLNRDLAKKRSIDDFRLWVIKKPEGRICLANIRNDDKVPQYLDILEQAPAEAFEPFTKEHIISSIPELSRMLEIQKEETKERQAKRGSTNRVILNENVINRGFDFLKNNDIREDFDILGHEGNYTVRIRTYTQRDKKDSVKIKNIPTKEEAKSVRDILLSINSSLNQDKLNAIFKSNSTLRKLEEENPEITIEEGDSNEEQVDKTIHTAMLAEETETLDSTEDLAIPVCDANVYSYFVLKDEMTEEALNALEDYELTYDVVRGNYIIKGTSSNLTAFINNELKQEGTEAELVNSVDKEFSRVRTADEEKPEEIIDKLIADEEEAIKGYEKAMENASEKNKALYSHIITEELEHIEELKNLKELHSSKTEDSTKVEDTILVHLVGGVPQRIVKTDADNKYHGLFTPQYKTMEGKLINLGTFETPTML